jgi:predicted O-methyltransferase YrrM
MSLNDFLRENGVSELEGNCDQVPAQKQHIAEICFNKNIKNILEIGFNAGHSAEVILSANKGAKLTSFDLNIHSYTSVGKEYIDKKFPDRHVFVAGDSKETVPKHEGHYECFFIDGGHDYETAKADIENCKRLARPCAMVMMDDVVLPPVDGVEYSRGPTQAWIEAIQSGLITSVCHYRYGDTRGMAVGFYSWAPEPGAPEPPIMNPVEPLDATLVKEDL